MIKEIWCMPHSHLDIGYTHPQPLLLELQSDYLSQALELCKKTEDYPEEAAFRWTIEANHILRRWLKTAPKEQVELLKRYVKEGRICITALPVHTTPNADAPEMIEMLSGLEELREIFGAKIKTAINHDVNGQPWTIGQLLLDSGVDFYLTGINIHFGGIPFQRPCPFYWEMADGRRLLSFLGEHYSLFSQFMFTQEHRTDRMAEGAKEYTERLLQNGYSRDFVFLTATNPPLYDNNCPDAGLPELIRRYNEEGHEQKMRIVTADMLRERVLQEAKESIQLYRGDWTDYWNFGCGSTPRETRVSRLAKQAARKAEVIECWSGNRTAQYTHVKQECKESSLMFDEHTWGASQSVTEPDSPETYSQLVHKTEYAYRAADLSGYLLSTQAEGFCGNPHQSDELEGVVLLNTSDVAQTLEVKVPKSYLFKDRQLSAIRSKGYVPYLNTSEECESLGIATVEPFSAKTMAFAERVGEGNIEENTVKERVFHLENSVLETPYYMVKLETESGKILQITDKKSGRNLLDESRGYALFEPVRESIDAERDDTTRETLFPRDVDLGNRSISQWNHEWHAKRLTAEKRLQTKICTEEHQITFVSELLLPGMKRMEQRVTFYSYRKAIRMETVFWKEPVCEPESVYFAIPLKMGSDWKCNYDTAGETVLLDEEQMGAVCRDWITVDTGVSVYEQGCCVVLSCPDAPMVQVGGFRFGKESRRVEREENPLLLAWPLNNYWNTNFLADPSGRVELAYELTMHESFDAKTMREDGVLAQQPTVICAAASLTGTLPERKFLTAEGKPSILHVCPAKQDSAVNVAVKNLENTEEVLQLAFSERKILHAELVTPQENVIKEIEVENGLAKVCIPPRRLVIVRLTKE